MSHVLARVLGFTFLLFSGLSRERLNSNRPSVSAISGTVSSSEGVGLSDAVIIVHELAKETRSRAGGDFRFEGIPSGTYVVSVRLIGYSSQSQAITVGERDTRVDFRLRPISTALASIVVAAERGGLSGIVLDSMGDVLPHATVRVLGAGLGATKSNTLGEFYLPVKAGHYMVAIELVGFSRRLVSVTIPADAGRRITAQMLALIEKPNPLEGANLFDLQQRLIRASPIWTRLVTREDLAKFGSKNAQEVAQRFSATPIDGAECAKLDGGPQWAALWTIDVSEIEFMETTSAPPRRRMGVPQLAGARTPCRHVVWLRR